MSDKNQQRQRDKGDKSIIDHVADTLVEPEETIDEPMVHKPTTRAGEPVERQVRKEWEPNKKGGLPTFLDSR
jgi:hypothetical protein